MSTGNQNRAALQEYLASVRATLATGQAGEHAYRGTFESLIRSFEGGQYRAINEPRGETVGRPDFVIHEGDVPVGYVECKDIGADLEREESSEQLGRYRDGLHNLILTDYLTFRWYVEGEFQREVTLATRQPDGTLSRAAQGYTDVDLLLKDFLSQDATLVNTPQELARRMAIKTRLLRDSVRSRLAENPTEGSVAAFQRLSRELLAAESDVEAVADTYAQTAAYGLFAAWQKRPAGSEFTRQSAVFTDMTPFLGDALDSVAGRRTEGKLAWVIDDLARLLDKTDRSAIMQGFARAPGQDDPIIHFYEDFLAVYDSSMREKRGVYYTPLPVVSYIVRSIDKLLRDSLGIADGLADTEKVGNGEHHRVTILDPAVGTGTFLREVVAHVRGTIRDKGLGGIWPEYVKDDLLPRLHGFELLMAPYTISHLSLSVALSADGTPGDIGIGDREINVVLTNSLEPAHVVSSGPSFWDASSIEAESSRADDVKRDRPVMVVLGNPPYFAESANDGQWIRGLLRGKDGEADTGSYFHVDGEPLGERNPRWLNDDYVKFIRFAQWRIEQTGEGVLGFITNHSYLDNPTFRGMRHSLLETFDDIYILDLHGNAMKREKAPDGSADENIFNIQQGVAIALFIKRADQRAGLATVRHADLRGKQGDKHAWLGEHDVSDTEWTELNPRQPGYFFIQRNNGVLEDEYERGYSVANIFPMNSVGIVTARDKLTIQWSEEDMVEVVTDFAARGVEDAREHYALNSDAEDWKVGLAQQDLRDHPNLSDHVTELLYRPFDMRHTYYTGQSRGFICRPRQNVMRHMLAGQNLGLISSRQVSVDNGYSHAIATRHIVDARSVYTSRGIMSLMPLYLYPTDAERERGIGVRANLDEGFVEAVIEAIGLTFTQDGPGDLKSTFGPEDVFHYVYAILHSPGYRTRYGDFLKSDFPRIPLTRSQELFRRLITSGRRLTELHLMEAEPLTQPSFPEQGNLRVDRTQFVEPRDGVIGRVMINRDQYFEGVSKATWDFTIGGYRPAQKWLKDRKGRTLTADDVRHYRAMCGALSETQELMVQVDGVIEDAGGWPLG